MKILRSDLTWAAADTIRVGDELLAFDEHTGGQLKPRRWAVGVVEEVRLLRKPGARLFLDDGTVVKCSLDHQWLTVPEAHQWSPSTSKRKWMRTADLDGQSHWALGRSRGQLCGRRRILKPLTVWETLESRDAGYLAGFFDGEGSVSRYSLTAAQRPNEALASAKAALDRLGFSYTVDEGAGGSACDVASIRMLGGLPEHLRFLGSIRPRRLLGRLNLDHCGRFDIRQTVGVERVERIDDLAVVSIQTTTRTFICEGLASHNCVRYFIASRPPAPPAIVVAGDGTFEGAQRLAREHRKKMGARR